MNLHGIVSGAIGTVNPQVMASLRVSDGYTTAPDGSRIPTYADPVTGMAQVQALTFKDLSQLDGINMNGEARAIYLYGQFNAVLRAAQKGGDLITLTDGPNAGGWLIVQVLEQWPDWCKAAVVRQQPA